MVDRYSRFAYYSFMRKIVSGFLILLFIFPVLYVRNLFVDRDWFTFVLKKELAPSSPANIGKIVLDAPAGKHGFLRAKNSTIRNNYSL